MKKWFSPKRHSGWEKTQSPMVRRRNLMGATDKRKNKQGRYIQAGRMSQSLSNVTKDPVTKRLARRDANYFFKKGKKGVSEVKTMAKKYKFTKKRRVALKKAQRKWKNMSPHARKIRMPNPKRRR